MAGLFAIGWFSQSLSESIQLSNQVEKLTPVSFSSQSQYEIVLIYMGCSTCGAANIDSLQEAFLNIKKVLNEQSAIYEYDLHTIGISKGFDYKNELEHLAKYGPFDEILVGNNWSNTGLLRYVFNQIKGPPDIPQIIITKRKYRAISSATATTYRAIENEILLERKLGYQEIITFATQEELVPSSFFNINF